MRAGEASITRHLAHKFGFAFAFRQTHSELGDDTPQVVNLLLPPNVTDGAARILDVLVTAQDLPDRLRLGSAWIPHMDSEHERVAARVVVEYRLHWRVGKDSDSMRTAGNAGGSAPEAMT